MGNAGTKSHSAVVLQRDQQLHFRERRVEKEVAETIQLWQAEGSPLGFTRADFIRFLDLAGREAFAGSLFSVFDTDLNGKVDSFELLSVVCLLAEGSLDSKIDWLFPVFDFGGLAQLNFDEVNILLSSVCRGLAKVCDLPMETDEVLVQASRQLFDAHNLPYGTTASKEQLKRWLRHDVEIVWYLDTIQQARSLAELDEALAEREQVQADVFQECSGGSSEADFAGLLRSPELRHSLGDPSEEAAQSLLRAMAGESSSIDVARFAEGTRAWNSFCILDFDGEAALEAERFSLLRWLSQPEREGLPEMIPKADLAQRLARFGLPRGSKIFRDDWIGLRLRHVGGRRASTGFLEDSTPLGGPAGP